MAQQSRRKFLKSVGTAAGAAGVFAISGTKSSRKVLGANDDIHLAVVGLNGRGASHIGAFKNMGGVRLSGLCDVDYHVLERRAKGLDNVEQYQDVRRLLENKNIDAISVATCNHWHALITFWACQAGKDVYVEKPCSHNVFEGRQCVKAARKYNRIVQHGTQSRASGKWNKIAAIAQSGKYGKLLVSKGYCCKSRWSIGYKPFMTPPDYLDFNLWLGPAPKQPYHQNLVHYNWHWFWDTGNGDMGNQGVHQMDIARWVTGRTLPKSVLSVGGRWVNEPGFKDQAQTPNQICCVFDYGDMLVLFETRGLVGKFKEFPAKVDNELYFEEGAILGEKFHPKGGGAAENLPDIEHPSYPEGNFGNFIKACRTRNYKDLCGDIEQAHYSSALCHLGNIPYRMGKMEKFGEVPKSFQDNELVSDSVKTMLDNTKALGVNEENTLMMIGPKLDFDPEKEKFIDNPAADELLTRPYRQPFVVTEEV